MSTPRSIVRAALPPSVIKYQWNPIYNPNIYRNNGEALCQYCPGGKFDTLPVLISLALDPGMPSESYQTQCSAPVSVPTNIGPTWLSLWNYFHPTDASAFKDWQIPGSNSFAHIDISRTVPYSFPAPAPFTGGGNESITEKTMLDLNQPQQ